jgi:hypothetical protein
LKQPQFSSDPFMLLKLMATKKITNKEERIMADSLTKKPDTKRAPNINSTQGIIIENGLIKKSGRMLYPSRTLAKFEGKTILSMLA